MSTYEVIVGNVGSVHFGKRRAEAIKRYKSYVESSKAIAEARCFGENVTLLVDREIDKEHVGHLREE
jgi:hypothetical protein